jgi:2-dehydropantoate 2-reductase
MKHAVLGMGGVGGLLAALLGQSGYEVIAIVRPESVRLHPKTVVADRQNERLEIPISVSSALQEPTEVLWVAVKATQLESALEQLKSTYALVSTVVPLLNGIDHVARLRRSFGTSVVPATITVESERIAVAHVVQRSAFVRFGISELGRSRLENVMKKLSARTVDYQFVRSEETLMWSKLCFLAPLALVTTASRMAIGDVLAHAHWSRRLRSATEEVCTIAIEEGAEIDAQKILASHTALSPSTRSSMQKDLVAGRQPELDAIVGPILRGAKKHHLPARTCRKLNQLISRSVQATEIA